MFHSIFLRITLFFLMTFLAMGTGFYTLHEQLLHQQEERLQGEASLLLSELRKSIILSPEMRYSYLRRHGYEVIKPHSDRIRALHRAFSIVPESYSDEIKASIKEGRIRILKDNDNLYVYLTKATPPLLVMKPGAAYHSNWPEVLFIALLMALFVFYLLIVKTLFPLKTLIRTINRYGTDGIYTPIQSTKHDEIAMVSNALDTAMHKSQSLLEARRLFLRNIMHELKTPITVGKLALPFLKKSEEKSILERAFVRMEHLIQELVRVEQITSGTLAPRIRQCNLEALINKAAELLFLKQDAIKAEFDGTHLYGDCEVMVTVFKNLIDNAIKYSPDHTLRIRQTPNEIAFCNKGEPWPDGYTLQRLSEPFFHHQSASHSFGLGLYIIQSVIEAHGFTLSHRYASGEHCFTIRYPNPPSHD